jgi:hypothetical protein
VERPAGSRGRAAFAVAAALYTLAWLAVFASRVGDYWKDVLRHFPWARTFLG